MLPNVKMMMMKNKEDCFHRNLTTKPQPKMCLLLQIKTFKVTPLIPHSTQFNTNETLFTLIK